MKKLLKMMILISLTIATAVFIGLMTKQTNKIMEKVENICLQ